MGGRTFAVSQPLLVQGLHDAEWYQSVDNLPSSVNPRLLISAHMTGELAERGDPVQAVGTPDSWLPGDYVAAIFVKGLDMGRLYPTTGWNYRPAFGVGGSAMFGDIELEALANEYTAFREIGIKRIDHELGHVFGLHHTDEGAIPISPWSSFMSTKEFPRGAGLTDGEKAIVRTNSAFFRVNRLPVDLDPDD